MIDGQSGWGRLAGWIRAPAARPELTIAAFLLLGLAVRIVFAFVLVPAWESRSGIAPAPDAYPILAASLLDRGVLGFGDLGAEPTTLRGPAFPAWLAVGMLVGGRGLSWLGLWSGIPCLLLAAGVGGWVAARQSRLAGSIFFFIGGLHPLPVFTSSRIMSEEFYGATGFASCLLLFLALGQARRSVRLAAVIAAGTMMTAHILARPAGVLTLAGVLCVLLARRPVRLGALTLFVAASLIPAGLWSVRSSRLAGSPVLVATSLLGYNFWLGQAQFESGAIGLPAGVDGGARDHLRAAVFPSKAFDSPHFWYGTLDPLLAVSLEARLRDAAREYVSNHPVEYGRRVANGLWRFWVAARTPVAQIALAAAVAPVLLFVALLVLVRRRTFTVDRLWVRTVFTIICLHAVSYSLILPYARFSAALYLWIAALGTPYANLLDCRRLWDNGLASPAGSSSGECTPRGPERYQE